MLKYFLCFSILLCACSKEPSKVGKVNVHVTFQEPDAPNALWTWTEVEVTLYKNGEGVKRQFASTTQPNLVFEAVEYGEGYSVRSSADLERYYPDTGQTFNNVGRNEIVNFTVDNLEINRTILLKKVP